MTVKIFQCFCPGLSADDKIDHGLMRGICALEKGGEKMREWFDVNRSETA